MIHFSRVAYVLPCATRHAACLVRASTQQSIRVSGRAAHAAVAASGYEYWTQGVRKLSGGKTKHLQVQQVLVLAVVGQLDAPFNMRVVPRRLRHIQQLRFLDLLIVVQHLRSVQEAC